MEESGASVLRTARNRGRLSQSDLARRAGIAQSVISAYETGRREPSLRMLTRLVKAAGFDLVVSVSDAPSSCPGLPDTPMGRHLRQRRTAVLRTTQNRKAHNVRVFGSVARGDDVPSSDIDLLVDFDEGVGLLNLIGLERELSNLLGVRVDVTPADSLKPRIRDQVLRETVPL